MLTDFGDKLVKVKDENKTLKKSQGFKKGFSLDQHQHLTKKEKGNMNDNENSSIGSDQSDMLLELLDNEVLDDERIYFGLKPKEKKIKDDGVEIESDDDDCDRGGIELCSFEYDTDEDKQHISNHKCA